MCLIAIKIMYHKKKETFKYSKSRYLDLLLRFYFMHNMSYIVFLLILGLNMA